MSSNWSVKKLGDLVTFLSGGTPSKSNKDYWNGEIPWISASSMQSTRYHDSDLRVTSLGSTNGTRLVPAETVLLLVRGGALHNKIPVGITTREVTFNQDVKALVPKSEDITPYYLLAWLISSRELLLGKVENTGIGAGKLDTKILQDLDVPVPPKAELLRLELFSKALDDKIILNQNINHTLEQMAQALFKSWFVDFEPVKAKMAVLEAGGSQEDATLAAMTAISGKDADALVVFEREQPEQYAELKATAELFPSAMQESELGEIPEGWELSSLSEKIKLIGGGTPKRSEPEFWNGDICWYSVKDAPADSDVFVIDTTEKITKKGLDKSSAKLLPIGTTIISARGTVGKLALTATEMAMNQSCYGISGGEFSGPLLTYLKVKQCVDVLKRNTHGAVFDTITTSTFDTVVTLTASKIVNHRFEKIVTPLFNDIENNLRTNASLTQLRDTLLPKLLSGEITLPEAEQAVSEAENV